MRTMLNGSGPSQVSEGGSEARPTPHMNSLFRGWVPGLRDHQRFTAVAYPYCVTRNVHEPLRWRVARPSSNGSFTYRTESHCPLHQSLRTASGNVQLPVALRSRGASSRDIWTQNRRSDHLLLLHS